MAGIKKDRTVGRRLLTLKYSSIVNVALSPLCCSCNFDKTFKLLDDGYTKIYGPIHNK